MQKVTIGTMHYMHKGRSASQVSVKPAA